MQIDEKAKEALIDQTGRMVACGWRGNPHMSGDDRNFMQGSHRRRFDDQVRAAVEFVLSAAYESAKQKGGAEGWVLVPREPTDEMIWQGNDARRSVRAVENTRSTYRAMACCRFRGHRDWVFHEAGGGICSEDSLGVSSRSRRSA